MRPDTSIIRIHFDWDDLDDDAPCTVEDCKQLMKLARQDERHDFLEFLKKIQFTEDADLGDIDQVSDLIAKRIEELEKLKAEAIR